MAEIIRKAMKGYRFLFIEITDPRTEDWFLVAKPYQGLLLVGIYLMFVFKWGPRWMKNRPAFNMDRVLIVYNTIQIITCLTIFLMGLRFWGWGGSYKWVCQPVDYTNSEEGLLMTKMCYCYYLLKVFDLLDTVFFVLRKKFNQVSFLHVYHHTGMVMLIWGAVTYYPGGHGSYIGIVNSFVHVAMYTYYMLAIVIPSVKNLTWFKKLITQLQIIQFFLFVVHMSIIIFKPDCQYPRWVVAVFLPQNVFMLILFIDFYIKSYIRKPKNQEVEAQTTNSNGEVNEKIYYNKYNKNAKVTVNGNGNFMARRHDNFEFRTWNLGNNQVER